KVFFAGGDLHGLLRAETGDDAYQAWLNEDKGFLRRLEKLPVPVVAAINGAALGGGFEICLACNHRIIVDDPRAIVGLPEVTLGLLPGAGGVARLPRMLEVDDALDILLTGRSILPAEALRLGLVDAVVPSVDRLLPAAIAWILANPEAHRQPWDRDQIRRSPAEIEAASTRITEARVDLARRTRNRLPAPQRILDIMEQALDLDIDETLRLETTLFSGLLGLPETRAAISTNFFATNAIRSGKLRPSGERSKLTTLCVVGSGDAATTIAHEGAARGIETCRVEPGEPVAASAMVLNLCQGADDAPALVEAHLRAIQPESVYGFHSAGGAIRRNLVTGFSPDRLFGFHLPAAPKKSRLVEIVKADGTSQETLRRAYDFFQQIGRTPIIVQDVAGFYVSRVVAAYLGEGLSLLADGMAPAAIEDAAEEAGMALPPLLWLDEVLDTPATAPLTGLADVHQRLIRDLLVAGRKGKASGKGAYDYDGSGRANLWPGLSRFRERQEAISPQEAIDRLLHIQVIETLACLDRGILRSTEEADLGSIMGFGFPVHTGGTSQFIKGVGIEAFSRRCGELAGRWGDRFSLPGEVHDILQPKTTVLVEG
ncbi:3-hydroxyacyl-CoA dehydrogenase, partial [Agrobacterium tumefaciens]|uniref:enoyl-CoA hydratase-related protein n=1 Tax=Agrobacterium tumefaciens TaxID=358 RepID=UPI0015739543